MSSLVEQLTDALREQNAATGLIPSVWAVYEATRRDLAASEQTEPKKEVRTIPPIVQKYRGIAWF